MIHRCRRPIKHSTIINVIFIFILSHLSIFAIPIAAFSSSSYQPTTTIMLTRRTPQEVQLEIKDPVDPTALSQAKAILDELKSNTVSTQSLTSTACSPDALLSIAKRLGDIPSDNDTYIVSPSQCQTAFDSLSEVEKKSLLNIHHRVKVFAEAQRSSVVDMEVDIPGGKAGQSVSPCRGTLFITILSLFIVILFGFLHLMLI